MFHADIKVWDSAKLGLQQGARNTEHLVKSEFPRNNIYLLLGEGTVGERVVGWLLVWFVVGEASVLKSGWGGPGSEHISAALSRVPAEHRRG